MADKTGEKIGNDQEWRQKLTPEQFRIAREKGTERAFTGEYWDNHQSGEYRCVCCGAPLFDSAAKFDSGTGWPSFSEVVEPAAVEEERDRTHGMLRTEVHCKACGCHLGHLFPDGPRPTGLRYCINSASLEFAPRAAPAPGASATEAGKGSSEE